MLTEIAAFFKVTERQFCNQDALITARWTTHSFTLTERQKQGPLWAPVTSSPYRVGATVPGRFFGWACGRDVASGQTPIRVHATVIRVPVGDLKFDFAQI